MATIAESSGEVLRSERIAGGILSKVLNTFDMVAIFIAIVLFITNSPGIASAGPVAYIYLVVGFLTFLIPGAIVTGQLGRMFPQEGSIYVWTNKAFGPFLPKASAKMDYRKVHCPNSDLICRDQCIWLEQSIFLGSRSDMDDIARAFEKIHENRKVLSEWFRKRQPA